jgi:hypothetical protein
VPCDHRIAQRALECGVDTIKSPSLRKAVADAIDATEPRQSTPPSAV